MFEDLKHINTQVTILKYLLIWFVWVYFELLCLRAYLRIYFVLLCFKNCSALLCYALLCLFTDLLTYSLCFAYLFNSVYAPLELQV